jgi:hypothetical protein
LRVVFFAQGPDADGRRLWLRQLDYAGKKLDENQLCFHLGEGKSLDRANRLRDATMAGRLLRFGSWPRYRQEVACARAIHGALGWTLTVDEQRLMSALQDYAPGPRKANAA